MPSKSTALIINYVVEDHPIYMWVLELNSEIKHFIQLLRLRNFEFVLTSDTLSHCKAYLMCGFPFILFEKLGQSFHVQF